MNKDQFIDFINVEITHCTGESKRAFEGLKDNVEVTQASPSDTFKFLNALDADLNHYCILFIKNNQCKKFLIETVDKFAVYDNGQKTFARFMHRAEAERVPDHLRRTVIFSATNQLHRDFKPADDKLAAWNRCVGEPDNTIYKPYVDSNGERWCTFPGESLFQSVTLDIQPTPVVKLGYCVDCDVEESKYLLDSMYRIETTC